MIMYIPVVVYACKVETSYTTKKQLESIYITATSSEYMLVCPPSLLPKCSMDKYKHTAQGNVSIYKID